MRTRRILQARATCRPTRPERRFSSGAAGFDTRRVVFCTIAFPTGACAMATEVECTREFGGWCMNRN